MNKDDLTMTVRDYMDIVVKAQKETFSAFVTYMEHRLDILNHWREASEKDRELSRKEILEDRAKYVLSAVYEERHRALDQKLDKVEQNISERVEAAFVAANAKFETQTKVIERIMANQSRLVGIGIVIVPTAVVIGIVLDHVFFK